MTDGPIWLAEADVAGRISPGQAIDVLERAYGMAGSGAAASMRRAHLREGEAILHAVGGVLTGEAIAGTKTWIYTPGGAEPLLLLFSLEDGRVLAVIEAFALGQIRTSATTGLGTRLLARPDARVLALIGTGRQAFAQARAVATVRPIEEIRVVGRDAARRAALARRLRDELEVETSEHEDGRAAVEGADVVTTITRSPEPVLAGEWLSPGAHVNAVGAIVPSRRELDEGVIRGAQLIAVDSVEQARDDAGELRRAVELGDLTWPDVRGLSELVGDPSLASRTNEDVTVFKALGVGLSDVAIGAEILRQVQAQGGGRQLSKSGRVEH